MHLYINAHEINFSIWHFLKDAAKSITVCPTGDSDTLKVSFLVCAK
jgi:hypothetical protein